MKNNLIALSIFCFAVCFIIGSWILSNALNHKPDVSLNQTTQRQLLTQSELVDYLGLSKGEIQLLTELPDDEGDYTSELPHIKVGKVVYYPKTAIDKWLVNMELLIIP